MEKKLLFAILCLFPACTHTTSNITSEIREINAIQEVAAVFNNATKDDLFVFDVDEVLLESADPHGQSRFGSNQELHKIDIDYEQFVNKKKDDKEWTDHLKTSFLLHEKKQLIEQALAEHIFELQKHAIKVIALTAFHTGKRGQIDRLENTRYQQLLSVGFNFNSSFGTEEIRFDELQKTDFATKYQATKSKPLPPAVFYKGIICSSSFPKGMILKAFLEKIKYNPKRIFFFDDQRRNVESVVQSMKEIGISCSGFVYKAAQKIGPGDHIDIKVAQFQNELIKQRGEYVGYFEAKEILDEQRNIGKRPTLPVHVTP